MLGPGVSAQSQGKAQQSNHYSGEAILVVIGGMVSMLRTVAGRFLALQKFVLAKLVPKYSLGLSSFDAVALLG